MHEAEAQQGYGFGLRFDPITFQPQTFRGFSFAGQSFQPALAPSIVFGGIRFPPFNAPPAGLRTTEKPRSAARHPVFRERPVATLRTRPVSPSSRSRQPTIVDRKTIVARRQSVRRRVALDDWENLRTAEAGTVGTVSTAMRLELRSRPTQLVARPDSHGRARSSRVVHQSRPPDSRRVVRSGPSARTALRLDELTSPTRR